MADWDTDDPGDTDIISDYPANERQQRANQRDIFGVDHHEPDDADQGKHEAIRLLDQGSDPAADANALTVYGKAPTTGDIVELFLRDSNGNVFQLTQGGSLRQDVVSLPEQSSAPSSENDVGKLYAKDVDGNTELFYMDDEGNEIQFTKDGGTNIDISDSEGSSLTLQNVISDLLTKSGYFRGKSVELEIQSDGTVEVDWEVATVFEITNTESHTITFKNAPDTDAGEAQTIYVVYKDAGAFGITLAAETGFTVERPANNPTDDLTGKTLLVCTAHGDSVIDVVPIKDFVSN